MISHRLSFCCGLIISLLTHVSVHAIVYGSTSSVYVYSAVTFPNTDSDNAMIGFGWFSNGFTLEDATTACVFSSVNPVAGALQLNGGTLTLQQDLVLSGTAMLMGGGTIIGNDHTIFINSGNFFEAAKTFTLRNVALQLSEDFNMGSTLVMDGDCYLSGKGVSLWLNEAYNGVGAGEIRVAPSSWLYMYDIQMQNLNGTNFSCVDDTAAISLKDVEWLLTDTFTFGYGSLNFYSLVKVRGGSPFIYRSGSTSTINYESTLFLDQGVTFSYDPSVAMETLISFDDPSSSLVLNGATLYVTTTGLSFNGGIVQIANNTTFVAEQSESGGGISLGDAMSANNDTSLVIGPGVTLHMQGGNALRYKNLNTSTIQLQNASSSIYIDTDTTLEVQETMNLGTGFVTFASGATLYQYPGKLLIGSIQPLGLLTVL